jgi:SAM-dependent methyltransferase
MDKKIYLNLYKKLETQFSHAFSSIAINESHIQQMARDSLNEARACEQIEQLKELSEIFNRRTYPGEKLLEIGTGTGLTVAMARLKYGFVSFGIEPARMKFNGMDAIIKPLLQSYGLHHNIVQNAVGEHLPFKEGVFDYIISSNVMEHVDDPQMVLDEAMRCLKPGGILQFTVPNYGSWWEGHYGILWIPHMPRWLGRWWVRLWRRNPDFLDELKLLSHDDLKQFVKTRSDVESVDYGVSRWEKRVLTMQFSEYAALSRLKVFVRFVHRLHLSEIVVAVGKLLHWETPIILTIKKKQRDFNIHFEKKKTLPELALAAHRLK